MGHVCSKKKPVNDNIPNEFTGLTKREEMLIKHLWNSVGNKSLMKKNGELLYNALFEKYPYMKKYFLDIMSKQGDEENTILAIQAQGILVFTVLTSYLDNLDDFPTLVALIEKRVPVHYNRGVTMDDMEKFKYVFLDFLRDNATHQDNLTDALAAWSKLLDLNNSVYKAKYEEMSRQDGNTIDARNHENTVTQNNLFTYFVFEHIDVLLKLG